MNGPDPSGEMKRREFLGAAAAAAALGGLEGDAGVGAGNEGRRGPQGQCGPTLQAARTESPAT